MTMRVKKQKKRCRHTWGAWHEGSFEDGTTQTCTKCRAVRFRGERYAYGSRR